jgi:hypothetical protein
MAAAEDGEQKLIDDAILTDDDFSDLLAERLVGGAELLDRLRVGGGVGQGHAIIMAEWRAVVIGEKR